jgi:hypothetical protein
MVWFYHSGQEIKVESYHKGPLTQELNLAIFPNLERVIIHTQADVFSQDFVLNLSQNRKQVAILRNELFDYDEQDRIITVGQVKVITAVEKKMLEQQARVKERLERWIRLLSEK